MAFKIASGYVEVEATYNRRTLVATGRRAGRDAARGFNLGFLEQTNTKNFDPLKTMRTSIKKVGRSMGASMASSFNNEFADRVGENVRLGRTIDKAFQAQARATDTNAAADNIAKRFNKDLDKNIKKRSGGLSKSIAKHMFNAPDFQFWMLYAILGALAAAAPAIGAAFSVAFTLIGGGAMAALGIAIAAKAPLVRKQFGDLTNNIKNDLKEFAEPFEETLLNTATHLEGTWKALAPSVERAFADTAPTIDEFNERALNHLETWDEVIDKMSDAFNELINEWMDPLGDDMERLREEFENIFEIVSENPEDFVKILNFIMDILIGIIDLIGDLSKAWTMVVDDWEGDDSKLRRVWNSIKRGIMSVTAPAEAFGMAIAGLAEALFGLMDIDTPQIARGFSTLFVGLVKILMLPIEMVFKLGNAIFGLFAPELASKADKAWDNMFSGLGETVEEALQIIFDFPVHIAKFLTRNLKVIELLIVGAVKPWLTPFTWLYDKLIGNSVIPDLVNGILGWFLDLDTDGDSLLSTAVKGFLNIFEGFRKNGISEFSTLRTGITSQMSRLGNSTIDSLLNMKKRMGIQWDNIKKNGTSAARSLVTGWGTALARFAPVVAPGISALVSVVNRGIIDLWDKFAPKLGKGKIGRIKFSGLARGGVLPGYSSYRNGDDQLVPMRQGEGVYVSEAMRDPYERARLFAINKAAMQGKSLSQFRDGRFGGPSPHYQGAYKDQKILDSAVTGSDLPGFARGGIVPGSLTDLIKTPWEDFAGSMKKKLSPMSGLRDQFKDRSSTFMGVPYHMLTALVPSIIRVLGSADTEAAKALGTGGATGQAADVIKKASSYVGKVSGRPNQFSKAMGMPFGPWCAAFISEIFRMVNATGSIMGITATNGGAAVRTFNSKLKHIPHGQRRPGDLASYRGSGHINLLAGKSTTIGGNESNRVRRQNGYVNSATAILRPKYKGMAQGGIMSGTRDVGGLFPNKSVQTNFSGQAEVVQTLDQIQAIAAMLEASQGSVHIENLIVEARKIDEVQKLVDTMNKVRVTSRKGGVGYNGEEI